uniref:Uncharacterized protein n=1 Tax=Arundo donax TaxID=35708 RepID=A0A0A9E1P8_ARUDO
MIKYKRIFTNLEVKTLRILSAYMRHASCSKHIPVFLIKNNFIYCLKLKQKPIGCPIDF